MMLYMLMNLATKGIMYANFVNSINELYKLQHTLDNLSYLDYLSDYKAGLSELDVESSLPQVFAPFGTAGEHSGILLRTGLLKALF